MTMTLALAALAVAVIFVIIALLTLQKKSGEVGRLTAELESVKEELRQKSIALLESEESVEQKIDDVVQSSIQKISHAEQGKEEAVKAAQDNYDAAADAHGIIKEREATIKELQGQLQASKK
jgi:hypothetical protein